MSLLIHPEKITFSTSSGSAMANTNFLLGVCMNILIKPQSETTQYGIKIVNPTGITVMERQSETGTFSELTELPMRGIYTVYVQNATNDESFIIELVLHE